MTDQTTAVLGIDPGLDRTGWAILTRNAHSVLSLRACGLIHTDAGQELPERLEYIFNELQKILQTYAPDQVAMEQNFFLKRAATMANTVMTRGVIILACRLAGKAVSFYPPKRVKMIICGTGTADKKQVQRMVQLTLRNAAAAGVPCSICGESAADPVLAARYVRLGARCLSLAATSVAEIKDALNGLDLRVPEADAAPAPDA